MVPHVAAVVTVLTLVPQFCHAKARYGLHHGFLHGSRLASTPDIEDAIAKRDENELQCMSLQEAKRASQVVVQAHLERVERTLQAVAAAEVQLKAQQDALKAKEGSIEARLAEIERLCGRLEEGRNSQLENLKQVHEMAESVLQRTTRMEGDYSAKTHEIEGSFEDQVAWLQRGSEACSTEYAAVNHTLTSTRDAINEVEDELKALEEQRSLSNSERVEQTKKFAKLQEENVAEKTRCDEYFASMQKYLIGLQQRRAANEGGFGATDCEVSPWQRGECSKECEGGTMTLTREVLRKPSGGGGACPALTAAVDCNTQPCEVSCQIGEWSEWTVCSRQCNGGHRSRNRTVVAPKSSPSFLSMPISVSAKVAMMDNDETVACGLTQDVESCNTQVCGDDCELGHWGAWGPCTKACGGGKQGRIRKKTPATSAGAYHCKGWASEFSTCQAEECPAMSDFRCGARQNLVFMIDSSELLSPSDFETQKKFVVDISKRFKLSREDGSTLGVVFFGLYKHGVLPPTDNHDAIEARVEYAEQGRGGQNLELGMEDAEKALFDFAGRGDAPSTVFAIIQGKPDSIVKAIEGGKKLKDRGVRVVLAIVGSCVVNERELDKIVSEPIADNLFFFKDIEELHGRVGEMAKNLCPRLEGGQGLPIEYLPTPGQPPPSGISK